MKPKTFVASTLITLGIAAFLYQGFLFMTGGPDASIDGMRVPTERTRSLPLLPIFGAIALIGGIAWVLVDRNDFKPAATP